MKDNETVFVAILDDGETWSCGGSLLRVTGAELSRVDLEESGDIREAQGEEWPIDYLLRMMRETALAVKAGQPVPAEALECFEGLL